MYRSFQKLILLAGLLLFIPVIRIQAECVWETLNFPSLGEPIKTIAFHPVDSNTLYVSTVSGQAYKSQNGGVAWERIPLEGLSSLSISPAAPRILYAISRFAPYKSVNGGETWQHIAPGDLYGFYTYHSIAVSPTDANLVYLLQDGRHGTGTVLVSRNGGDTWETGTSVFITGASPMAIHPQSGDVYILLYGSMHRPFLKGSGNGTIWEEIYDIGRRYEQWSGGAFALSPADLEAVYLSYGAYGVVPNKRPGEISILLFIRRDRRYAWTEHPILEALKEGSPTAMVVHPHQTNNLFLSISVTDYVTQQVRTDIWHSPDGGSNWESCGTVPGRVENLQFGPKAQVLYAQSKEVYVLRTNTIVGVFSQGKLLSLWGKIKQNQLRRPYHE